MRMQNDMNEVHTTPKKILITGMNSFIGQSFNAWLSQPQYSDNYLIETIDTIGDLWREQDFSSFEVVFHVAGIAHVDTKELDEEKRQLYYKVNRDLTIDVATKAKAEGVKQFIFMSSSIVFGENYPIGKSKKISKSTTPSPSSDYGKSKLQAEEALIKLQTDNFHVVIMRPPMIYGKGCKGNYPKLSKYARVFPVFLNVNNERSVLHIDNLCELLRMIIDSNETGIFYPQNKEYISTSAIVKEIANIHEKHIVLTKLFNPLIYLFADKVRIINKVFGNFTYDKELSNYKDFTYCVHNFEESIERTECITKEIDGVINE